MKKRKTYNQPKKVVGKTPEQRRNQIYAYILAFAMIFWTIASVLGVIGFFKTCDTGTVSASAEEVDSTPNTDSSYLDYMDEILYGPYDLHLEGATCVVGSYRSDEKYCFINNSVSFMFREGELVLSSGGYSIDAGIETQTLRFGYGIISVGQQDDILINGGNYLFDYFLVNYDANGFYISTDGDGCAPRYVNVEIENDFGVLTWKFSFEWYDFSAQFVGESYLNIGFDAYLTDDKVPVFYPYANYYTFFDGEFGYETDELYGVIEFTNIDEYNYYRLIADDSYDIGEQVGYQDGYTSGRADGYQVGREDGYQVGREDGFTQGVASANEYSFNGLFSSIFDVPVKTFTSLFSFDVLGVDLSGLFFSILTVGIILAVVKWLIP